MPVRRALIVNNHPYHNNTNRRNNTPVETEEDCTICYENKIGNGPKLRLETFKLSCNHQFCNPCARDHFRILINDGDVDKLRCMQQGCNTYINTSVLVQLYSNESEVIDKLKLFREKKSELYDPLLRFCPRPLCQGRVSAPSIYAIKLTCPDCQIEICFSCREEWHGYFSTCEGAFFNKLGNESIKGENRISFCPICRTKIQKNYGCNHMTCKICSYQWWWCCEQCYFLPIHCF